MATSSSEGIDKEGRLAGDVALYIKECFDVEELGVGNDKVECLWVRTSGKACRGDMLVGSLLQTA